ncbi:MAG: hypothetical protein JWN78_469 [Bacteroidota bacterium]|nr:hypothetical protein [Bacteroidota bacterium]
MAISKTHHYIPKFFIKGFTDDSDNMLWIYDKKQDKILKNKRSPKSVFFGEDINSFTINNQSLDLLEEAYSKYDNYFANHFIKIREELVDDIETTENTSILDVFIMFLFWRRYPNNAKVNEDATGLIQHLETLLNVDERGFNNQISDKDIDKLKKSFLAFSIIKDTTSDINLQGTGHYKILDFKEPFYFISDNPIIFDMIPLTAEKLLKSIKIFPISKYRVYLGLKDKEYTLTVEQSKLINLLLIEQADKYIGSFSKQHLESFVNVYRNLKKKEGMFDYLKTRLIKEVTNS